MTKRRIDTSSTSTSYWERVLKEDGLDMNAGLDPGHRKVLRVGNTADLERVHTAVVSKTGRVRPRGAGPDE